MLFLAPSSVTRLPLKMLVKNPIHILATSYACLFEFHHPQKCHKESETFVTFNLTRNVADNNLYSYEFVVFISFMNNSIYVSLIFFHLYTFVSTVMPCDWISAYKMCMNVLVFVLPYQPSAQNCNLKNSCHGCARTTTLFSSISVTTHSCRNGDEWENVQKTPTTHHIMFHIKIHYALFFTLFSFIKIINYAQNESLYEYVCFNFF